MFMGFVLSYYDSPLKGESFLILFEFFFHFSYYFYYYSGHFFDGELLKICWTYLHETLTQCRSCASVRSVGIFLLIQTLIQAVGPRNENIKKAYNTESTVARQMKQVPNDSS